MKITLDCGYTSYKGKDDTTGECHREVTFGQRYDGAAMFAIDDDPQSAVSTQFQLLTVRATITAFGTLPMPVPLDVLLKLDMLEIEDLIKAHNQYMAETIGERKVEYPSNSEVFLAFGYRANGHIYDRVTFGKRLNGYDRVAADTSGHKQSSLRRQYFLIGREITRLSTRDGQYTLDGPFGLEMVEKLDAEDVVALGVAATLWRESFRASRDAVQADAPRRGDDAVESPALDDRTDSGAAG